MRLIFESATKQERRLFTPASSQVTPTVLCMQVAAYASIQVINGGWSSG